VLFHGGVDLNDICTDLVATHRLPAALTVHDRVEPNAPGEEEPPSRRSWKVAACRNAGLVCGTGDSDRVPRKAEDVSVDLAADALADERSGGGAGRIDLI